MVNSFSKVSLLIWNCFNYVKGFSSQNMASIRILLSRECTFYFMRIRNCSLSLNVVNLFISATDCTWLENEMNNLRCLLLFYFIFKPWIWELNRGLSRRNTHWGYEPTTCREGWAWQLELLERNGGSRAMRKERVWEWSPQEHYFKSCAHCVCYKCNERKRQQVLTVRRICLWLLGSKYCIESKK